MLSEMMLVVWFAALSLVAGAFLGIVRPAMQRARVRRQLRAGSTKLEHGAAVTLIGVVRDSEQLLNAPLSGRRAVAYLANAQLPEVGPDDRPIVLSATQGIPFELDTVTAGIVVVEATQVELGIKPTAPKPRRRDLEEAFMVGKGRGATAALAATFREVAVTPGMRVAVHGEARIEHANDAERGYRDVPRRTRIVAAAGNAIAIGEPPPP